MPGDENLLRSLDIRLRYAYRTSALEPWHKLAVHTESTLPLAYTYFWYTTPDQVKLAQAYRVRREETIARADASAYLPLIDNVTWSYRRRCYALKAIDDPERSGNLIGMGQSLHWRIIECSMWGQEVCVQERARLRVRTQSTPATQAILPTVADFTVSAAKVDRTDGGAACRIAISDTTFRDGRYVSAMQDVLWAAGRGRAGAEFSEVSTTPVPESIPPGEPANSKLGTPARDVRLFLIDAGFSRIRLASDGQAVLQGLICEKEQRSVRVEAGTFTDCLRVTEYLLPESDSTPLSPPKAPCDDDLTAGWVTVSWYARSIGLVRELQVTNTGLMCYEMHLTGSSLLGGK
jgi:hypothetical protein